VPQLITSPRNRTFLITRPDSYGGMQTRRLRPPCNESCGDCGGSGADSSGKTCGTCNGLGEIHCLASLQGARVPSRSMIRKEGHRWPTL
jgi:DnaJ-class molecular chaperone